MKTESVGNVTGPAAVQPKNKQETAIKQSETEKARRPEAAKSETETSKQKFNVSILQASMDVSISAGNNSMGLLFKSAIEHINQALAPELGDNAIQNAASSGMDFSPQATADRIVSASTAFFGQYVQNHPEKDQQTALNDFIKLIGGGVDKGFADARQVLDGLKVLQGDIASNIDKTYELIQSGFKSFVDNYPGTDKANAVPAKSAD
ncbi:MAG: DUF5610 domain-containing protein [Gallionella sp.]|nr:DUF5610 domain-containing protein [Gallionella sp.]